MQITVRYVTVNCIFLYYYAYYVAAGKLRRFLVCCNIYEWIDNACHCNCCDHIGHGMLLKNIVDRMIGAARM